MTQAAQIDTNTTELASNKAKVVALLESLNTGDPAPVGAIKKDKYIQHNLDVADGLESFGAVMKNAPPQGFKAKVHRVFADGNYVVTHTEYDFFGRKAGFDVFRFEDGLIVALKYFAENGLVMQYDKVHKVLGEGNFVLTMSEGKFGKGDHVAFYDLFRLENGLIVEHWDVIAAFVEKTASGRTMVDGPSQLDHLEKTESHLAIMQRFVDEVLLGGQSDQLASYVSAEQFHQHGAEIEDGLDGCRTKAVGRT